MGYFKNEADDKAFEEIVAAGKEKDIWTTQDGREIPVKDLEDSHLINIMKILNAKGYVSPETVATYVSSPRPNGDMAQLAFDEEFARVLDTPVCNQLEALEAEVKERGLEIPEDEVEEDTTTDINEYRELRKNIAEHETALAEMNKMRTEIETRIFSFVKTGEYVDYEEFRFEAKTGKRSLTPKAGFESTWKNLIADCEDAEQKKKLGGLVTTKTVHKGPTLGELEKALPKSEYLRDHYEEVKSIFGYKEGSRREAVVVTDKVADEGIPGLYCHSKVAGTTYRKNLPWESLAVGDALELIREPDNEHDRSAIRIVWNKEAHIGYINTNLAQTLAPLMDNGTEFYATISAITGGGELHHGCNIDIIYK